VIKGLNLFVAIARVQQRDARPLHRASLAAFSGAVRPIWAGLAALLLLSTSPGQAQSAGPPTEPQLRIEAGMHTTMIRRVSSDAAGRYAVTASDDKTARVWDIASGKLLQVLRPPIAPGNEGKLFAVSMHPNGDTVAVSGWTGWDWYGKAEVYLFDRSSGQLRQRLTGLPSTINCLAHSADGRWLVATLSGKNGIRVWPLAANGSATQPGAPLADTAYDGDSYGASFSRNGRLTTTSNDGQVRLYALPDNASAGERSLKPIAQTRATGGQRPRGVAFAPNGQELAVGYGDSTRVDVLDGQSLVLRHTPSSQGVDNGNLSSVAWSADGQQLLAAGMWHVNTKYPVRLWLQAGRGQPVDVPTVLATVMSLQTLPQGRVLVGGCDPMWGVLDAGAGSPRWQALGQPPIADLRDSVKDYGYALSASGQQVQFGYEPFVKAPHRFDIKQRSLLPGKDAALSLPRTSGLDVQNWVNNTVPTLAGQALQLQQYEPSRSLAITPDAAGFALGANWSLRFFTAQGQQRWEKPVPGTVWGVNIPKSGKLVVAAYGDGTIRWHRLSDGQELLAFFPHADRKRWVLWTPTGYFDASPDGEDLIGWHVNRGADAAADFFPASQFRSRFHRPDVIDRILDTLDEAEALKQADAERGARPTQTVAVTQVLPPVVEVQSGMDISASSPSVTIKVKGRSATDAPVSGWRVRVNGQAVPDARGLQRDQTERELVVPIPPHNSEIQLFAENRHGVSTPATVRVKWTGSTAPQAVAAVPVSYTGGTVAATASAGFQIQPKLFVLAVGVAKYQHKDISPLGLSAKDARDFAVAMQGQKGKLYREVEVKVLTDEKATRDDVIDGLEWLQKQVTQHDVGMVFIAGHGTNDPTQGYTYLPVNADPDKLRRTGVAMDEFKKTLASLPGKALFFFDTCHAGNVLGAKSRAVNDVSGVINELASAENGVVVFSSSTGRQLSYEDAAWGNGAFTKALVEGINGAANYQNTGRITHKMLDLYISERVKQLTKGKQSPVTQAPGGVPDYPVAVK
jgi:WD40 repeat protein